MTLGLNVNCSLILPFPHTFIVNHDDDHHLLIISLSFHANLRMSVHLNIKCLCLLAIRSLRRSIYRRISENKPILNLCFMF